ncbi:MAG: hypothetical protein KBT46_04595 [Ruminococcus sp.]|nr:hypothetical protein [Candidatus Copronaster equi]
MGLKSIDKSAQEKGSGVVTLWQFVKFIFVSLIAFIVQYGVLNILLVLPQIKAVMSQDFSWFVFNYIGENKGLGYFIAVNTANILAQIVSFFINREKTFNSSSKISVTLPIYIIFTLALICFSAWFAPTAQGWLLDLGSTHSTGILSKLNNVQLTSNISSMICSAIQFFLYFPVDKILFRKPKEE